MFFFSNLGQFLEINYFSTQYYNGKGKKKGLHLRYTNHIKITSRVWQVIWGPDIFSTKKSRKWPQDHYFSQKVLFYLFLTQYYNRKERKGLHLRYTTHIKRNSRVWQAIWGPYIFSTKKVENGLRIIIFHKKCYFTHF